MSDKNKKQFGIWMDSHNATIIGRGDVNNPVFSILAHVKNAGRQGNSNENTANNAEKTSVQKFFREIMIHMQNAEEVHVTGTGDIQEQFIHFLADTAQFKNVIARESTSTKMEDKKIVQYFEEKFN